MTNELASNDELKVVDLLDRVLARGVVITGNVTLSVADVDLVDLKLRILLSATGALMNPRSTKRLSHEKAA
jgi:hypothetical protein